jgi:hypothetical protein
MATMDAALFSRLSSFAGLKALIGTRIYPAPAPQNAAYPLVTYQEVSRVTIQVIWRTASWLPIALTLELPNRE